MYLHYRHSFERALARFCEYEIEFGRDLRQDP